ncbi:hypothetical protein WN943_005868 [Citrus x changshan-huyou]
MSDGNNKASDDLALIVGNWKKDNSKKKGVYWKPNLANLVKKLSNLKSLDLGDVSIRLTILHNLTNLSSLTFSSLQNYELQVFGDKVPDSIGNFTQLQLLAIYSNKFSSELLASIGNLRSYEILDIENYNFLGSIPSSLTNLTQLIGLDHSQNS